MTKYFVNDKGEYLGGFDCDPEFYPEGKEVKTAPSHALEIWNGKKWVMPLEQRNAIIDAQRAERYKNEFDPLVGRAFLGLITTEELEAVRSQIKFELPYGVE
jgi:hypothetical protein